jgi:hypothetical protein
MSLWAEQNGAVARRREAVSEREALILGRITGIG